MAFRIDWEGGMKNKVVTKEEWLKERRALLRDEKALTRMSDQLASRRRDLPWIKVEKQYSFKEEGGAGEEVEVSFADLFEGRSQLIVYHFMFGPNWTEGCPGCTLFTDNFNGIIEYLNQSDASMVVVSRASPDKLQQYRQRMGWRFRWVSSEGSDFNFDFQASFREPGPSKKMLNFHEEDDVECEENHGTSVFYQDAGDIFHTYSCYARSVDPLSTNYQLLDLLPKGRSSPKENFSFRRA